MPPRAPELSLVENVWQLLRENWLFIQHYKSYDHIVDISCYAWCKLFDQPWKIMCIGDRRWAHEW